jgi:hypothetical protein
MEVIPNELWVQVVGYLDDDSLYNLKDVSARAKEIVEEYTAKIIKVTIKPTDWLTDVEPVLRREDIIMKEGIWETADWKTYVKNYYKIITQTTDGEIKLVRKRVYLNRDRIVGTLRLYPNVKDLIVKGSKEERYSLPTGFWKIIKKYGPQMKTVQMEGAWSLPYVVFAQFPDVEIQFEFEDKRRYDLYKNAK